MKRLGWGVIFMKALKVIDTGASPLYIRVYMSGGRTGLDEGTNKEVPITNSPQLLVSSALLKDVVTGEERSFTFTPNTPKPE